MRGDLSVESRPVISVVLSNIQPSPTTGGESGSGGDVNRKPATGGESGGEGNRKPATGGEIGSGGQGNREPATGGESDSGGEGNELSNRELATGRVGGSSNREGNQVSTRQPLATDGASGTGVMIQKKKRGKWCSRIKVSVVTKRKGNHVAD